MYEIIEQGDRSWAIDWTLVHQIVHNHQLWQEVAYHTTERMEFVQSMRVVEDRYFLAYDVDHKAWREATDRGTRKLFASCEREADNDIRFLLRQLEQMQEETRSNRGAHYKKLNNSEKRWKRLQNEATGEYATAIKAAQKIRNASAEFIVIGATVVTGGAAAVGFAALGSGMKGVATYQDTGNLGAAAFEASTTMLLTAVPIARGGKLTGTDKAVLVVLDANFETGKSLIAGDSVEQAIAKGSLKAATSQTGAVVGPILKNPTVRGMLSRSTLPSKIAVSSASGTCVETLDLVGDMATWTVNSQIIGPYVSGRIDEQATRGDRLTIRRRLAKSAESTVACVGTLEACADKLLINKTVFPLACVPT